MFKYGDLRNIFLNIRQLWHILLCVIHMDFFGSTNGENLQKEKLSHECSMVVIIHQIKRPMMDKCVPIYELSWWITVQCDCWTLKWPKKVQNCKYWRWIMLILTKDELWGGILWGFQFHRVEVFLLLWTSHHPIATCLCFNQHHVLLTW